MDTLDARDQKIKKVEGLSSCPIFETRTNLVIMGVFQEHMLGLLSVRELND